MKDTFELVKPEYELVPAGDNVILKIEKAVARPKANPTIIEVTFAHEDGGQIVNKYDLVKKIKPEDKSPLGLYLFSLLVYATLGNDKTDFSISKDLPKMVGYAVDCKVEHTQGSKGGTFANIKRVNGPAEIEEDVEEETAGDEEDDL